MAETASFNFDTCLIKKNGDPVWVHVTTILIEDNGGRLGYTILEDISERKEAERLRELIREQEQRQQIAETILNTQEEEHRRVGESLHNSLGQLLYGIKLNVEQLKGAPGKEQEFHYTQTLITSAINECRRISHDLMPAVLMQSGLKAAVAESCIQLSGETRFSSHTSGFNKRLPRFLEVSIYRIIQELLLNIVKHAAATAASVDLQAHGYLVSIRVTDNGKGMDGPEKSTGIGLQTIRYKVRLLSGTIDISSAKGQGTIVAVRIPMRVD